MILGIGTDVMALSRLDPSTLQPGDSFYRRAFTEAEKRQAAHDIDPPSFLARRFCAKEAIYKAISLSGEEFHPGDIEVVSNADLHPIAILHGKTREAFARYAQGPWRLHVSMSSEDDIVSAFALAERVDEKTGMPKASAPQGGRHDRHGKDLQKSKGCWKKRRLP